MRRNVIDWLGVRSAAKKRSLRGSRTAHLSALAAGLLLSLPMPGAAIDIYDAGRDKQASAAKDAWHAIDVTAPLTAQQQNLQALLAAELKAQDQLATAIRDQLLTALVGEPLDPSDPGGSGLKKRIGNALTDLLGEDPKSVMEALDQAAERQRAHDRKIAELQLNATQYDLGQLSCSGLRPDETPPNFQQALASHADDGRAVSLINDTLSQLRGECGRKAAPFDADLKLGGRLADAHTRAEEEDRAFAEAQAAVVPAQIAYQKALRDYTAAVAGNASKEGVDAKAAIKNAADRLSDAVTKLEGLHSPLAVRFLSQERLDALKDFVTTVTQGVDAGKVPQGGDKGAAAFVLFENLANDARSSLADARTPLNTPLQVYRDQQKLTLDATSLDVNAWKEQVRLSREVEQAILDEARVLWRAMRELTEARNPKGERIDLTRFGNERFYEIMAHATTDEKEVLMTAAAYYLDAVDRYDARRYKLEYMRIAAIYDRSLAYSTINVKRWQSLIDVSVDQVADFYAGGIKPDAVGTLLQFLGLAWIGHGVNK